MITNEAIDLLKERFTDFNNYDVEDVRRLFAMLSFEDVEKGYRAVIDSHEFNVFPKPAKVRKYFEKAGVGVNNHDGRVWYYACKCGAEFSIELGGCPECKNKEYRVFYNMGKRDVAYHGRNGCFACPKFNRGVICTTCDNWGTGVYSSVCNECQGKRCCQEHYQRYAHKINFKE